MGGFSLVPITVCYLFVSIVIATPLLPTSRDFSLLVNDFRLIVRDISLRLFDNVVSSFLLDSGHLKNGFI